MFLGHPHRVVKSSILSALFVSSLSAGALASNVGDVIDFSIHQQYLSPRAMGMGNAFVGLADDHNAIFYNPAGLARLEEGEVNMGLGGSLDTKVMSFVDDVNKASASGNVSDVTDLLAKNYGNHYGARVTLGGIWARPKWALAVMPLDLSVDMAIHQLGGAALDAVMTADTTIAYGRGWDVRWFKQDRMSIGVTAKFIHRAYLNRSILASDLAMDKEIIKLSDANEGFTADLDIGTLWTPKISSTSWFRFLRPSVGFVIRNVADYGFTTNFHLIDPKSGQPRKLGRRFDLGTAWELPDWWVFKTRLLADMRDMGADNFTIKKGAHLGAEFNWKVRSWWRGGWRVGVNQGYFTAGFTGKVGIFNLDLATYGEEFGPSEAPKASRRYMAKAALDW